MRRDELIRRWQTELRVNEEHQLVYGPRFVWLYRSRARIYRLLLRIYGSATEPTADDSLNETDSIPAVPAQLSPTCSVLPETFAGKPAKDLGAIRKVLKSVTAANDGFPAGNYSRRDVEHDWIIVASGTRRRSPALYQVALEHHRIAYQFAWEGAQWAIRTRFADKDRAQEIFSTIQEYRRPQLPRVRIISSQMSGLPNLKPHLPLLAMIGGAAMPLLLILFSFSDNIAALLGLNEQAVVNHISQVLAIIGFAILTGAWYWTYRMSANKVNKT